MGRRTPNSALLSLAFTLQHAHVSADIGIPQSDLEQIVREVAGKTVNPVICIAQGET